MDIPRGPSIALPLPLRECHFNRNGRYSPPPMLGRSATSQNFLGMPIPGANREDIPPALPPPRYINDHGCDLAWSLQNGVHGRDESTNSFVKPGSSLYGGDPAQDFAHEDDLMEIDLRCDRRDSAVTAVHDPTESIATPRVIIPRSSRMGPSSPAINPEFHGEQPLAQQNQYQAIHAYDKEVLRKIDKGPSLLPYYPRTASSDQPCLHRHVVTETQGQDRLQPLLTGSLLTQNPSFHSVISPSSAVSTSPTSRYLHRGRHSAPRSPSPDAPSLTTKTDRYSSWSQQYTMSRQQPPVYPFRSSEDAMFPHHRGSYDSSVGMTDTESVSDDIAATNQQIRDRPHREVTTSMKRRALSRPADSVIAEEADVVSGAQTYATCGAVDSQQQAKFGSFSSTESSLRPDSFTSSSMLSAATSSLPSTSSYDPRTPPDPQHPLTYITLTKSTSSPSAALLSMRGLDEEPPANKTAVQPGSASRQALPTRIGNAFICSCCPKKPKKFLSEEQLRDHESEKQYTCAYCIHRFKNKNEAERHQNSLHLRKHSWSCAAIRTAQDAFHPSNMATPASSLTDYCGFCGEEFSNNPAEWNDRLEHLTNVHKFRECNSSKKFFRADHFRQHLKHSHGGKSGKWTNMLENACMREESGPDSTGLSPAGSEHSQSTASSRALGVRTNPTERPPDRDRAFGDTRYPH